MARAVQGDPAAARELRAWLERLESKVSPEKPLRDYSPEERRDLRARIAAARMSEDDAQPKPGQRMSSPADASTPLPG